MKWKRAKQLICLHVSDISRVPIFNLYFYLTDYFAGENKI